MAETHIARFRRKPQTGLNRDQIAAKYEPGDSDALIALQVVAQTADMHADLVQCQFRHGWVLIARWRRFHDEHPSTVEYLAIEPGQWLAYDPGDGFLYQSDDKGWKQFYDRVSGDG